jgi:hypothetical protein
MAKIVPEADHMVHNKRAEKLRYVFILWLTWFILNSVFSHRMSVITDAESVQDKGIISWEPINCLKIWKSSMFGYYSNKNDIHEDIE